MKIIKLKDQLRKVKTPAMNHRFKTTNCYFLSCKFKKIYKI